MTTTDLIALITIILPFFISLASILYKHAIARLPQNKAALLATITQTAVQAAEQSAISNAEKKRIAVTIVQAGLKSLGVHVDPLLIDATVEQVVYAMRGVTAAAITQPQPAVSAPVPLLPQATQSSLPPAHTNMSALGQSGARWVIPIGAESHEPSKG